MAWKMTLMWTRGRRGGGGRLGTRSMLVGIGLLDEIKDHYIWKVGIKDQIYDHAKGKWWTRLIKTVWLLCCFRFLDKVDTLFCKIEVATLKLRKLFNGRIHYVISFSGLKNLVFLITAFIWCCLPELSLSHLGFLFPL